MAKEAGSSTFFWTLVALIGVALVFASLNPAMTGYAPRTVSPTSGDSWVGEVNRLYLKIAELESVIRNFQQKQTTSGSSGGAGGNNQLPFENPPLVGIPDKKELCPQFYDWMPTPSPVTTSNMNQMPPLFCFSTDSSLPCWPDITFVLGPYTIGCQYDRFVFSYPFCDTEHPPNPGWCQNTPVCNKLNQVFSTENIPYTGGGNIHECAQVLGPLCSQALSDAFVGCDYICSTLAPPNCVNDVSSLGAAMYGCDPILDIAQCDIYAVCKCTP